MPLPHYMTLPHFVSDYKLGSYKEYIYIGEYFDAKEYIWNENLPINFVKNTKYRIYQRIYDGTMYEKEEAQHVHIFIEKYDKTFTTRTKFSELLEKNLMIPISTYRKNRIDEILD